MLKAKKLISAALAVMLVAGTFAGCGGKGETGGEGEVDGINGGDTEVTTVVDVENMAPEERLSSTCDVVLAEGKDFNGDYYELVGTQEATATSVATKVGVIRNNEWLVPLSAEHPFIDKEKGSLRDIDRYRYSWYYSLEDAKNSGLFIGNGCFYFSGCIYNSTTQKYYLQKLDENNALHFVDSPFFYTENEETLKSFDGSTSMLMTWGDDLLSMYSWNQFPRDSIKGHSTEYPFKLINLSTMEVTEINVNIPGFFWIRLVGPLSEGLFCVEEHDSLNSSEYFCFRDITGKMVIDLSKYSVDVENSEMIFVNGKCTFVAFNAGKYFKVTIDKTGKVLSEEPWEKPAE